MLVLAGALTGCATGTKKMTPVGDEQLAAQKSEVLSKIDATKVVEKPELEPEWGDFVKDKYPNWRKHYWVDRGEWGNRGYLVGNNNSSAEPVVEAHVEPLPAVAPPDIIVTEPPKVESATDKPTKYVVVKGDSLWRIAGKVYHNPLKWPKIYRANQEKVKHPNKIYPGQVLTIPWE